jgi:PTH1 family peptidyl-tRNA hydrolase
MKIVFGLGNPGKEYNWTRHNFGFLSLDFYAKIHGASWRENAKFGALTTEIDGVLFVKPQSFYNLSGQVLRRIVDFYKADFSEDVFVICDDIDLDFGTLRLRAEGSSGGSNGLKSIIEHFSSNKFLRLKIGTKNEYLEKMGATDFVLSKFSETEKEKLPGILKETSEYIREFTEK